MSILLIRHGETAANAARVVQVPETPLSQRGIDQAERLARRLARVGVARIVASDLARAAQTADALARAVGAGVAVESDALLQERNFGDLRGTPYAELGVDLFAADFAPPGGEAWEAFHARVDRAWERIQEAASDCAATGHLAVVTHGLVCHSLVSRHLRLAQELEPGAILQFGNTSLTVVEAVAPYRVERLSCVAHLENDGPATLAL